MPCIREAHGFVCFAGPIYEFEGFTFENHRYFGPQKLNKNHDPAACQGPKFYAAVARWERLPKWERAKYRAKG